MKQSKSRQSRLLNQNRRVPETITSDLISKILSLSDCSFKTTYLKDTFLSKFVSSETDSAELRRERAIEKWLSCEQNNAETNVRLQHLPWEYNILPRVRFDNFVFWVRSLIVELIGEVPPTDCLIGNFSGGASTSRSRVHSHPTMKFIGKAHVTEAAKVFLDVIRPEMPGWPLSDNDIVEVAGNVLFTVPKKSDIDRCACKEPDLNMFMQKGVGDYLRRCLRREGINLNDQTVNQKLARKGSIDDSLSTLDLSSASDSVTCSLVELLLPDLWSSLLFSLRSPVTLIDGAEHRNEMLSSMGNGFTFELESLLFYSILRGVAYFRGIPGIISVYGDDLILPRIMAHDSVSVLSLFGFSINLEKSYIEGSFRESCGGHFLDGLDVTPFYLRNPIKTVIDVIDVANKLRQWCLIHESFGILNPEPYSIWLWLRDFVPQSLWGGRDYDFKYSLVTPDFPRKRLQAIVRDHETGLGGYYYWLSTTWRRDGSSVFWRRDHINEYERKLFKDINDISVMYRAMESHTFRMRPSRQTVTALKYLFLEECSELIV